MASSCKIPFSFPSSWDFFRIDSDFRFGSSVTDTAHDSESGLDTSIGVVVSKEREVDGSGSGSDFNFIISDGIDAFTGINIRINYEVLLNEVSEEILLSSIIEWSIELAVVEVSATVTSCLISSDKWAGDFPPSNFEIFSSFGKSCSDTKNSSFFEKKKSYFSIPKIYLFCIFIIILSNLNLFQNIAFMFATEINTLLDVI